MNHLTLTAKDVKTGEEVALKIVRDPHNESLTILLGIESNSAPVDSARSETAEAAEGKRNS
jgi:hypothetical protein